MKSNKLILLFLFFIIIDAAYALQRNIMLSPATPAQDYHIKVLLNSTDFNYSKVRADGGDIRFYDINENKLGYWISSWNNTGDSILWVKVNVSGTSQLIMRYNHPELNSESTIEIFNYVGNDYNSTDIGFGSSNFANLTDVFSSLSFPYNSMTVLWRIHSQNYFTFRPKTSNSAYRITDSASQTYRINSLNDFNSYIISLTVPQNGHAGIYKYNYSYYLVSDTRGYEDRYYRSGDTPIATTLTYSFSTHPAIRIWFRKYIAPEPTVSIGLETPELGANYCGDGIVQTPNGMGLNEQCDDANTFNTDACLDTCRNATCGDSFIWGGHESCEDGNFINRDGCSSTCQSEVYQISDCGDSVLFSPNETCDDGNTMGFDGCSSTCRWDNISTSWSENSGSPTIFDLGFLNYIFREDNISCNGLQNGNGCNSTWTAAIANYKGCSVLSNLSAQGEEWFNCTYNSGHFNCSIKVPSYPGLMGYYGCVDRKDGSGIKQSKMEYMKTIGCGNGIVESGEECDDGNKINNDACNNSCVSARCGDNTILEGVEECDDGNIIDGDCCSSICMTERRFECIKNGDSIIFGGKRWVMLDNSTNYVISEGEYGNFIIDGTIYSSYYDGGRLSNLWSGSFLSNYLNNNFYNETNGSEYLRPGTSIDILTRSQFDAYQSYGPYYRNTLIRVVDFTSNNPFTPNGYWLIPSNAGTGSFADLVAPGSIISVYVANAGYYRPVLYISTTTVKGGIGTMADPWVLSKLCGNGIVESGEECDDSNSVNFDGCNSKCKWENISTSWSENIVSPTIFDLGLGTSGFKQDNISCNGIQNGNGCNSTWLAAISNNNGCSAVSNPAREGIDWWNCSYVSDHFVCYVNVSSSAGVAAYYGCVNRNDGRGIRSSVRENVQPRWCGDGLLFGTEQCDNGTLNTNTPCTPGYGTNCTYCNTSCLINTVNRTSWCGDGIIQPTAGEQCDEGIFNENGSGCSDQCRNETYNIIAMCGDGVIFPGYEQCDDKNKINGDCCSTSCQLENECLNKGWYYQENASKYIIGQDGELYIEYAKPSVSIRSYWQVKHGSILPYNITIPNSCWNAYQTKLFLRFNSYDCYMDSINGDAAISQPYCYDGSTYIPTGTESRFGACIARMHSNTGPSYAYDGDWNTYSARYYWDGVWMNNGPLVANVIYEEAIWW
jgi:cysteine-rich repeat protein